MKKEPLDETEAAVAFIENMKTCEPMPVDEDISQDIAEDIVEDIVEEIVEETVEDGMEEVVEDVVEETVEDGVQQLLGNDNLCGNASTVTNSFAVVKVSITSN